MTWPGVTPSTSLAQRMGIGSSLVVGADGLIGHALLTELTFMGLPVIGSTHRKPSRSHSQLMIDLVQPEETWSIPSGISVAYLCAGVASIDQCRRYPRLTEKVNCLGSMRLAQKLANMGVMVVYLSSNQVFDGSKPDRLASDAPCPQSVYGQQKAITEQMILGLGKLGAVVRLTKVLPYDAPLFMGWRSALKTGQPVTPFHDMRLAPVGLDRVVQALHRVGSQRQAGITQVSGCQDITYAQAALHIAHRLGADSALVQPISAPSTGLEDAAMPAHTTLDGQTLESLGLSRPDPWQELDRLLHLNCKPAGQSSPA